MIRTFVNETGSPEVKFRRESPVIGGAKIYPGTPISFTEAEWEVLPISQKNYLTSMVEMGAFSLLEDKIPEIKPRPIRTKEEIVMAEKAKTEEVIEEKAEDVTEDAEDTVDATEDIESTKETEETQETKEMVEEKGPVEKEPKDPEEVPDNFNYDEFLGQPISKIKDAMAAMEEKPEKFIEKLIEAEKAGENRSSLIGWLTESLS